MIKNEIWEAFNNIFENSSFVMGEYVKKFEKKFSEMHNVRYCIGVSSGTAGNHLVLWGLGIKPGDEVVIPVNTFIATAWGVILCGAKPVFVDCNEESYNIDPLKIESVISRNTKAVVAVHLYGQPADMDSLSELAKRYNLVLVEDAAQSHLAEYKGKKVGGIGVAASFSFYPGKNLGAYGEAGAVMTNDEALAEKFYLMRNHGSKDKYNHVVFGHNYRMENIQGAVLYVKLKYLKEWTEKRRKVARCYNEFLSGIEQIILPKEMDYSYHVYHLYVIQINREVKNRKEIRDKLRSYLYDRGVGTGLHYPIPLHLQPCFEYLGYKKGDFPVAEDLADGGISLPIYPEITNEQIYYVSRCIKDFLKKMI